jgi:hypothetical protein
LAALDLRHPWWFAKVKIWQNKNIKNSLSAEFERISIPQKVCISYCYIQAGACRNICTILKALHLHHLASIHNEKGTERRDGPGQLQFALLHSAGFAQYVATSKRQESISWMVPGLL